MITTDYIAFTKSKLPYGWLGNMSPFSVTYEGKTYPRSEQLFMALRFDDEEIREAIRGMANPMSAKFFAKKNADKMVVEQRSEKDLDNMRMVVRFKVEQNMQLRDELLATGCRSIYEDVTARGKRGSNLFWGAMLVDGEWVGENWLGKIWMELRTEIRRATFSADELKFIDLVASNVKDHLKYLESKPTWEQAEDSLTTGPFLEDPKADFIHEDDDSYDRGVDAIVDQIIK